MIDVSEAAHANGVCIGMALAEARARCPGLIDRPDDPAGDRRAIEALGRWMTRFTPAVATGWTRDKHVAEEAVEPFVLLLDITGTDRLFGHPSRVLRRVTHALNRFDIPARAAVAPTVGAAWAIASSGCSANVICVPNDLPAALAPLPIESLRVGTEISGALRHLGLHTVGHLLALPRDALPARFGPTLLARLDQALGTRPETLVPLGYEVPIVARMELDEPADALEAIWAIFEQLLRQVVADLARRGHGARRLELVCRYDRTSRRADLTRTIDLSRPTRCFATLADLVRRTGERLDGGREGFVAFALRVPLHERLDEEQTELVPDAARNGARAFDDLIDRLRVRLGPAAVIRPALVESHLPELAWTPATDEPKRDAKPIDRPRPLQLLTTPAEVSVISEPSDVRIGRPRQFTWRNRVHRLSLIIGPERVGGEWWRGHRKTRDYYEVEDEAGLRFWIFRVTTLRPDPRRPDAHLLSVRWFLHGLFA